MDDEIEQQMMQQRMQQLQMQQALKTISMKILTPEARERLANIKLVKPDLATQLQLYLAQLYQAGQLAGTITEPQLLEILRKLGTKDFRIRRVEK